jgi:ketosteroid isomerase-like protein
MRPGAFLQAMLLATLCAACATPQTVTTDLDARLRARVQQGYVEPFRAGDVARWVEVFAVDALAYHDGPPALRGRAAIRGFGESVAASFRIRQFDVVVDEVRRSGNWALTAGHYTAMFEPLRADAYAGARGPRQGKFMFLWELQHGTWRIIMDMGNSTDPPPDSRP